MAIEMRDGPHFIATAAGKMEPVRMPRSRRSVKMILASSSLLSHSMKRVSVRRSPIHGKGVFALHALPAGVRIFEYKGLVTTWREAARWYRSRPDGGHTFLFGLSGGHVIDGGRGGNGARWLNHACVANCEAVEQAGRVYIETIRDIAPGEELFIDYALEVPRASHADALAAYACHCGTKRCRGTMLGVG